MVGFVLDFSTDDDDDDDDDVGEEETSFSKFSVTTDPLLESYAPAFTKGWPCLETIFSTSCPMQPPSTALTGANSRFIEEEKRWRLASSSSSAEDALDVEEEEEDDEEEEEDNGEIDEAKRLANSSRLSLSLALAVRAQENKSARPAASAEGISLCSGWNWMVDSVGCVEEEEEEEEEAEDWEGAMLKVNVPRSASHMP